MVIAIHQILQILLLFYKSEKSKLTVILCRCYCVKRVSSRSISGLYFSSFALNTESKSRYLVRM